MMTGISYCVEYDLNERRMCFANLADEIPHEELLRGGWTPRDTLIARWGMGKADPGDIAVGQTTAWYYLSGRVQQLLKEHKITGWSAHPIVLHNKAGEACPGYAVLSITGRCGPLDDDQGEVVPGQKSGHRYVRYKGLYFDESTWDGSDLFMPEGDNTYMFATERVKNLFEEHMIKGFEFTPLTEATWYRDTRS